MAFSYPVGQAPATGTNDDAAAGKVGELISATLASGSAVSLTTVTPKTVTSISLTAGDWDLTGMVGFTGNSTTTVTALYAGFSTTNNTLPGETNYGVIHQFASTVFATINPSFTPPKQRISLNATTTAYLVAQAAFGTSTCTAYGKMEARRVR